MRIGIRVQYILALLLLPVLAAAALLFSGSISARAYATTDLYTLTFANEAGDVSVRLNFMAETDQPGYCMYYADVTDFSALLPDGCTLDSFTNDDMVWNPSGSAVIARYNISYSAADDRFIFKAYYSQTHSAYYKYATTGSGDETDYETDCEFLEYTLFQEFEFKLRYNSSNISSLVTFKYIAYDNSWSEVQKLFYYGETPELPAPYEHWDRLFFKGWSPAIAPVSGSDPVTYTAQYDYPSVLVRENNGTQTRIYLEYDYIDEALLFDDFTDRVDDIGSTNVTLGDIVEFENRKDFWYCVTADTETKHTVDTNLTLEAISFRLRDKTTGTMYRLEAAEEYEKEVSGGVWGHIIYAWKAVKHTVSNWGESFLAAMQTVFTGDKDLQEEQTMRFLYEYYPQFAQDDPDNYELVYMYYYSVDLKEDVETGEVEDAYVDYVDDYKDSVLTVTNNINDTEYTLTNSYSLEEGNYFVLDMARYWQSMGYVTKEQFDDSYSAVQIVNAKYRITTDHGEVVYDSEAAANLQQALTTVAYYYTGDYAPDYADAYTLQVEFYAVTVYKEADETLPEQIRDQLKPVTDFFAKVWDWLQKYWKWVVLVLVVILLAPLVIRFIRSIIDLFSDTGRKKR